VIDSGGCPIEEESPPSWFEGTTMSTTTIFNVIPLIQPVAAMGGCVIEEQIPPHWLEDSTRGKTKKINASFNGTTETDLDYYLVEEETPPNWFEEATTQLPSDVHDPPNFAILGPELLSPC